MSFGATTMGDVRTPTNYQEGGAGALVDYISRDNELLNAAGEQMEPAEIQEFIDQSEEYEMGRQVTISPEDGNDLSDAELSLLGRRTMNELVEDRPTATYCYAIHRDTENDHVQVAMTGEKRDLWMDRDDCQELRQSAEKHHERSRSMTQQLQQRHENELNRELERAREQDRSRSRSHALVGLPVLIAALVVPSVSSVVVQVREVIDWIVVNDIIGFALLILIPLGVYVLYRLIRARYTTWRMKRIGRKGEHYPIPVKVEQRHPCLSIPLTPFNWPRLTDATKLPKSGSMYVIGESGSGKTEAIKLIAYQMMISASDEDREIVLDVKGDWEEFYPDERSVVVGVDGSTYVPNLFLEPERPEDWDEIAPMLLPGTEGGEDFFDTGARQVFSAVCKHIVAEFEESGELPTNADLVEFVRSHDREELYEALVEAEGDYPAATAALDPDSEGQASGVYASFQQQMSRVFKGDFAQAGNFSISDYMADPAGETLILRLDPKRAQAGEPMFSFMISWAIRHSLAGDERSSYFVLDEFARIPAIMNMEDLMNVGRGQNAQAILGIQSTSQITDTYGRDRGRALLDGLTQGVIKRVNANTVDDVRRLISKRWEGTQEPVYDNEGERVGTRTEYNEEHPFSESQLTSLSVDRAIVVREQGWIKGVVPLLQGCVKRFNAIHGFEPEPVGRPEDEERAEWKRTVAAALDYLIPVVLVVWGVAVVLIGALALLLASAATGLLGQIVLGALGVVLVLWGLRMVWKEVRMLVLVRGGSGV